MQLGAVGWSSLKKQIVSPPSLPSQNVDCCGPLSNAKSREGKRSMKNFSLFIARDSISFCFARSVTLRSLPSLTSMLELAHSIKVPQSIFQEIENERCFIRNAGSDTSLLFEIGILRYFALWKVDKIGLAKLDDVYLCLGNPNINEIYFDKL